MAGSVGFALGILFLTLAVIVLSRASQRRLTPDPEGGAILADHYRIEATELYLNVIVSQALVAAAIFALVWATAVPWAILGTIVTDQVIFHVGVGISLGIALYVANEASVLVLDRFGIEYSEALRGALAPSSIVGWAILLGVVLPVIAASEELLFRAALIGGVEASLGLSPWTLVIVSSVFFAVGHGIQGAGGVLVTGALGIVLGIAFVISNSLLLVIVAHYVVNALEFVVHEGIGISITESETPDTPS